MAILKFFKNALIIFFLFLFITIPVFIYLLKFNASSGLGKNLREKVIRIPQIVTFLNLNNSGDAKYVYTDPSKKTLSVRAVSVNSRRSNGEIERWMNEIFSETLGKKAIVYTLDEVEYPEKEFLTDGDLNEIRKEAVLTGKADLYIIYVSSYSEIPTSVGLVIHRDTIFIFRDTVENLSERGYVKDVMEKTTIMHEWGHLLGLEHFESEDCIMNESAEVYDASIFAGNLPTKYCWEELREIENLR